MSDIQKDFDPLNRKVTRRQFLKEALAGAAILLFGGCTTNRQPTPISQDRIARTSTPHIPEIGNLRELSEIEIKTIGNRCIDDFTRVLGLNISENAVEKINFVTDIKAYQKILEEEEVNYLPTSEKDRPGITTSSNHSKGRQIFLFRDAINELARGLPNTEQGLKAREDALEWIINHELAHWIVPDYKSEELHNLIYGKMFANIPQFRGREITPDNVNGAEIKAYVDGTLKSAFQNLEEAEAFIIGDYVTRHRGRPQAGTFVTAQDMGIAPQVFLVNDLLQKLGTDRDNIIRTLAQLRTETGGREKYGRLIGEKFGIVPNDRLYAGMSILYAIDIGDRSLYQRLTNKGSS